MSRYWKLGQAADQTGRLAVVTGANVGLGYETALALAGLGADVVLACRNMAKADAARQQILRQYPGASVECLQIDTSSLASVHKFAGEFKSANTRCDLLINNAGIMMPPFQLSEDGVENQFATNYLGHFLLTGLLWEELARTPGARVVTLSSIAHRWSPVRFDDVNFEQGYDRRKAYGQSKTACLMFAFELQRRFSAAASETLSLAAHPGISATELGRNLPFPVNILAPVFSPLISQSASQGALPTLRAALDEDLRGAEYIGPGHRGEMRGPPVQVGCKRWASDEAGCRRLWSLSEQLAGFSYPLE